MTSIAFYLSISGLPFHVEPETARAFLATEGWERRPHFNFHYYCVIDLKAIDHYIFTRAFLESCPRITDQMGREGHEMGCFISHLSETPSQLAKVRGLKAGAMEKEARRLRSEAENLKPEALLEDLSFYQVAKAKTTAKGEEKTHKYYCTSWWGRAPL